MTALVADLTSDQRDLQRMLAALAHDRDVVLSDARPDEVAALAVELADLGVWTLGAPESTGGGGADPATVAVALEQLGRSWPALAWASVQAHAAADVLGDDPSAELLGPVHRREVGVAVVDVASDAVDLWWDGGRLIGVVARVDAAHVAPHLLVLSDTDAVLVAPEDLTTSPVRRTGLDGALTRSVTVDAGPRDVRRVDGVDVAAARRRLLLGAAAIALGIGGAAADAARAYARERHQFGGPLTAIATVRASLLEQVAGVAALAPAARGRLDDLAAGIVARAACEAAISTSAAALQSHGGYGYLAEYPAERHLRDAVSLRAAADVAASAPSHARALAGHPVEPTSIQEAS